MSLLDKVGSSLGSVKDDEALEVVGALLSLLMLVDEVLGSGGDREITFLWVVDREAPAAGSSFGGILAHEGLIEKKKGKKWLGIYIFLKNLA